MECKTCSKEFRDGMIDPNGLKEATICPLCSHLLSQGLPYKYLRANESDYKDDQQSLFNASNSLFIHGGVGTGKTWLMAALMRKSIISSAHHYKVKYLKEQDKVMHKRDSLFVSFPEIAMRIRASMNSRASETESSIIDQYGKIKNLFLDDIGAEKSSEYMQSMLFMLIERRNTGMDQRTVITSNLNLGVLAQQHGERVASRITEMCNIVKLSGSDRRMR